MKMSIILHDFLSVPIGKVMETGSRCWGGTRNWGEIENCYPWLMYPFIRVIDMCQNRLWQWLVHPVNTLIYWGG